jgi:hypothetical protein
MEKRSDVASNEITLQWFASKCDASSRRSVLAGVAIALLATACATKHVEAEWSDPQFAGRSLAGAKVFVVCQANDLALRRLCADQMAARLVEFGATPLLAPDAADAGATAPPAPGADVTAARAAGAVAVFRATLSPDVTVVPPGPSIGISVGGISVGRRSAGGVGVGVGVPIGEPGPPSTGYSANGAFTDVATGRLMWTAKTTTPPSQDVPGQIGTLAGRLLDAARKAGLFQ